MEPGDTTKADGVAELERRRALARGMGGPDRVGAHHARGRLTARERVEELIDPGTLVGLGMLAISDRPEVGERAPADAAVTGIAAVDGRKVGVIANDATVLAGTTGKVGSRKQGQIMSPAARKGYPLVMLGDANGGRLPDLLGSDFAAAAGGDEGEHSSASASRTSASRASPPSWATPTAPPSSGPARRTSWSWPRAAASPCPGRASSARAPAPPPATTTSAARR